MRSTDQPDRTGVHLFTGWAVSASAAVQAAHAAYEAARTAHEAGNEAPHATSDDWSACGFRPGWDLDWSTATARSLHGPDGWSFPPLYEP